MCRQFSSLLLVGTLVLCGSTALANDYLTGDLSTGVSVNYYRPVAYAAAMPVATTAYYPQPTTCCQPVSCCQPVTCCQPTTCCQPVVQTAYSPVVQYAQPTVAYQPVYQPAVTAYSPVATPVYAARPVVARTTYYVPGQPIRNTLRWLGPGVPTVVGY